MTVDVFDKQTGKFLGTRSDSVMVRTGLNYYIIEDEHGNEFHYSNRDHKLIIHSK